ncbi:LysE family translocator [Lichenibacterium minor]|uniref:LysE family translocator n=1 Tax=Lichenibacterium minor TaxID=2316528 RepID=A0A4Q2U099_9HYPH|nr:LysE family transporter [Lichenibacterium minor]RYC29702.1 LysE family translocator [Lichenibacterium minor]
MAPSSLLPLVLFVLVATVSPGGATALATASGASFGYRRSLPLIGGIAAGLASMAVAAAVGLAGMLLAVPSLQLAMKGAGSIYLLWLGWQIAGRGAPNLAGARARPSSFAAGVWMLWHNPKAWAMTTGAAASFAALADGPARLGALLGLAFGLSATLSLSLWCGVGLLFGRLLRTDRQWQALNVVLGILLALTLIPLWL